MPPSTNSSLPVMKLLSSDARNDTALAGVFRQKPTQMGPAVIALFEDTCGNLIQT